MNGTNTGPTHLVMPMAGRGSRFEREGIVVPKPLIPLNGEPFFVWAIESVLASVAIDQLVCVVLREHIERHAFDREILSRYPHAVIEALDEVTTGAAETAAIGIARLAGDDAPFLVNDCDHAFDASGIDTTLALLANGEADAALLGFRSSNPGYSYAELDAEGQVTRTVEKQVISPYAIAGCYVFAGRDAFAGQYEQYRKTCQYDELFMSGVYNSLLEAGGQVAFHELRRHVAFGTPQEMARVQRSDLDALPCAGRMQP